LFSKFKLFRRVEGMSEDQVVRLRKFREDHPDIEVRAPSYASDSQLWSAHRDGLTLSVQRELRGLLDKLEWILEQPAAAAS
jgi:hypothetical protein